MIEVALNLPFVRHVRRILSLAGRSLRVLRASSISEHWKERALLRYAVRLMASSVKLAAMIGLLLAVYLAVLAAAGYLLPGSFDAGEALLRADLLLWTIVSAALYLPARRALTRNV